MESFKGDVAVAVAGRRRKFTREFIVEAIQLSEDGTRTIAETAKALGIHENQLYRWRHQYREDATQAFPGKGRLRPRDEEVSQLKKELERVSRERDILKKAVAIFSKMPQ